MAAGERPPTGAGERGDDGGDADATGRRPSTLTEDDLFETLANRRRRYAVEHLRTVGPGERVSFRTLVEAVASRENDCTRATLTARQRKRVYTALYQRHVPKMAAAGVLDYDRERGTVALAPAARALDRHLDPDRSGRGRAAALVGAVGWTGLALEAAGVAVLASVPPVVLAAGAALALATLVWVLAAGPFA
jgi:hypothetical protein